MGARQKNTYPIIALYTIVAISGIVLKKHIACRFVASAVYTGNIYLRVYYMLCLNQQYSGQGCFTQEVNCMQSLQIEIHIF